MTVDIGRSFGIPGMQSPKSIKIVIRGAYEEACPTGKLIGIDCPLSYAVVLKSHSYHSTDLAIPDVT